MAVYVFNTLSKKHKAGARPRLIMDFVDLDSDKWRQYADYASFFYTWIYRIESYRLFQYEKRINQVFDASVFVCQREVDVFRRQYPSARNLHVIENGINAQFFMDAGGRTDGPLFPKKGPVFLFVGVMDYFANEDAVVWFSDLIFPKIRRRFPGAEFLIVGNNPTDRVWALTEKAGVSVTGFVEDIRPYYVHADVCVIPLRIARGLQNKVLEAMLMGKGVVATSNAADGIHCRHGHDILIADKPDGFAEAVIRLLLDDAYRKELGRNATGNIRGYYSWQDHLSKFQSILEGGTGPDDDLLVRDGSVRDRKRVRVAHVTFDMRIGGAERVIVNLVRHTDRGLFDVSVICLEGRLGPFGLQLEAEGTSILQLDRKPGFDWRLIGQICEAIRRHQIDILHCHQYTPYVYGVLGAAMTGCKVIFTEHGRFFPDLKKRKRMIVNPLLHILTDRVTAISEATRQALAVNESFPEKAIQVIYNGIDRPDYGQIDRKQKRAEFGIDPDAFVMGTVARLDPIKNHPMMIRALKRLQGQSRRPILLIVGDGPERDKMAALASKLSVSEAVVFTGYRDDAEQMYPLMDLFLLTSFSEGTAMTLLEAMAAGLPAIVTDVGGNPEIVEQNRTGFIVPSDDAAALAEKVNILMNDPDQRGAMQAAASAHFETRFTANEMAAAYEKLYRSVLE